MEKGKEIIEYSSGDTITIDEILKDDQKALDELKEIREMINKNPDLFYPPEEEKTHGQIKMKQLLEDARRDLKFAKKLEKFAKGKSTYRVDELSRIYLIYSVYLSELRKFQKKYLFSDKYYRLKKSLCRKYGIDPVLFDRLANGFRNNRLEGWDFSEDSSSDMCTVEIGDEHENPEDIHDFHVKTIDQITKFVYPVKIRVHAFASQRDIIDFVEKRWNLISPFLKEKRIKQRKLPREVSDFIWKHRGKKAKEISILVSKHFPEHPLMYFEINRFLNDERKRRNIV